VLNLAERDADKLDKLRVNADLRMEKIIREQERVIEAATTGIKQLNSDMKALTKRLTPKMEAQKYNDIYYSLKDQYVNKLAERGALERARVIAEESIVAAKLHVIPGEFDRSKY